MEEFRKIRLEDINVYSVIRDVAWHFWVIILAAASAWMLTGAAGRADLCPGLYVFRNLCGQYQREFQCPYQLKPDQRPGGSVQYRI